MLKIPAVIWDCIPDIRRVGVTVVLIAKHIATAQIAKANYPQSMSTSRECIEGFHFTVTNYQLVCLIAGMCCWQYPLFIRN